MQSGGGRWTGLFRVRRGEELQNNSLLSAGVPGKEQVRRYPLHCFYSVYLTPLQRGEVKRRRRDGRPEALTVQENRKVSQRSGGREREMLSW